MSVDVAHLSSLSGGSTLNSVHPQPNSAATLFNDFPPTLPSPLDPPPSRDPHSLHGGSPSSTMTLRKLDASPRIPFLVDATLRRRSSRLSRWLLELHASTPPDVLDPAEVDPIGTQSNPYLAYPHLSMPALRHDFDDADSMHDYVVVDQDIALECPPEDFLFDQPSHESAPADIGTPRSTVRLINPPQSLRHFRLSRRSVSPSPRTAASSSPSRFSMFHRPPQRDLTSGTCGRSYHTRSTSLQTSLPRNGPQIYSAPRPSSWRWRPSVLGHFSSASVPDTDARISPGGTLTDRSRSRPSISSSNTCSSIATPTTMSVHEDGESPVPSMPPSKTPSLFGSLRVLSQAGGIVPQPVFQNDSGPASSPSLRPQYPASAPHLPDRQMVSPSSPKSETTRFSFSSKSRRDYSGALHQIFVEEPDDSQPHVLFAGKTGGPRLSLPSLGSPTRQAKKRKLVVSGIPLNDTRRLDAIQRWCQSFGDVDQITRVPNGDLHINFQKAEVADTVCRVRAKVYIAGAGSVHLSWISGNKRK